MRVAMLLVTAALALAVLWLAGEEHRRACIASGNSGCSVLPWDNGTTPALRATEGRLTERGCQELRISNALALSESEKTPLGCCSP